MSETWWEYLDRISGHASQMEIARAAGVNPASVSRWNTGKNTPSAESVIKVARHYQRSPVEALIAADYLTTAEAKATIELAASITSITDKDLIREVERRMGERRHAQVTESQQGQGSPQASGESGESGAPMTDQEIANQLAAVAVDPRLSKSERNRLITELMGRLSVPSSTSIAEGDGDAGAKKASSA